MNLTKLRYHGFFKNNPETTRRTIDRLRELKLWMARPEADGGGGVPPKDTDATLLLATRCLHRHGGVLEPAVDEE